jgi:hypothetical protein
MPSLIVSSAPHASCLPGPLEDADLSDDEDDYDWYTLPRALDGRVDAPTAAALKSAAHVLDAAHAARRLDAKWGGVFGQELVHYTSGVATSLGHDAREAYDGEHGVERRPPPPPP